MIGPIFLRVFGQSKIFSGAFGTSQFRPKNFFGASGVSNNSGSPAGDPPPPPQRKTLGVPRTSSANPPPSYPPRSTGFVQVYHFDAGQQRFVYVQEIPTDGAHAAEMFTDLLGWSWLVVGNFGDRLGKRYAANSTLWWFDPHVQKFMKMLDIPTQVMALRGIGGRGGGVTDALEEKGPQRRLGRRLEEVAKAVGGGYCRLQMPLRLALGVRGTVAGHRLGTLDDG